MSNDTPVGGASARGGDRVEVGGFGPVLIIVCLAIVGGTLWFVWSGMGGLSDDLVYYRSASEVMEAGPGGYSSVRLGGQVEPGSVDFDIDTNVLTFEVTDGITRVPVTCSGAPPQMFREGIGVVVEGSLQEDGVFHTDRVLVKHSNEYRAPEDGENPADVYQTLAEDS